MRARKAVLWSIQRRRYSALVLSDPFLHYQALLARQQFRQDESQLRAAKELQKLYRRIENYQPPVDFARKIKKVEKLLRNTESTSVVQKFFSSASDKSLVRQLSWEDELLNVDSPRGLLLSGSVGSGKSVLIDMLLPLKKRWHYNAFMLELFSRLHRARDDEYILLKIAYELIEESPILAIDEFQLGDPASARIMKGILIYFWKMGGVLVATSNRMPEDLYSGSFQAEQFKSFTELLSTRCVVHDMRSMRDFRREVEDQLTYYRSPSHDSDIWDRTIQSLLSQPTPHTLQIYARTLTVLNQDLQTGTARFTFTELCGLDLGPADYISIAATYKTIIIDSIPILTSRLKNEARRFISLIDALYESKCRVLLSAAAHPDALFFPEDVYENEEGVDSIAAESYSETFYDVTRPNRPNVSSYSFDPPSSSSPRSHSSASEIADGEAGDGEANENGRVKRDFGRLSGFTGEDEKFAYLRAKSRVFEMTSKTWWESSSHDPASVTDRAWERKREPVVFARGQSSDNEDGARHDRLVKRPRFGVEHFWAMVARTGVRARTNPKDWEKILNEKKE